MKNIIGNVCIVLGFLGMMFIAYDMIKFQYKTTKKYTDNLSVIKQYAAAIQVYKTNYIDVEEFSKKIEALSTVDPTDYKYNYTK